ncbi:hypothetical protein Tco_0990540 [Tanacetum coccineum]|uniref:Uncharacterized protein n=1 Tax=Tanacetum coccineum TaxID=301880 RepID=A0ABQ5EWR6_9ASTR
MTSFSYCLNPLYAIKECSSCGSLYTKDCGCSEGSLEDKILVPKPLRNCARCAKCGTPVDGSYCRGCALLRKKFKEDLFAYCVENFQDFEDTSESSDDNTNVVNAPQEPCIINQDPGKNPSPSPPQIDHCCHECGDSLDGIFCQRCTCKSYGKGAHYGYNCPPKVPIISITEPCKHQTIDEPQQNCKVDPDPRDLISIDLGFRKNVSTTNVNVPLEDDQSSLFAYVVWIFLAFLTYPVVPLISFSTRE